MNILIASLLSENTAPRQFGCLMALPPEHLMPHFVKFNKTVALPHNLYIDPNDPSFGVEEDPHITIKYGFSKDLTDTDLASILQGLSPFSINFGGLSLFENEKFDVVKFDVEHHPVLTGLRKRCDSFPNEDKYKVYHPHSTIAYVKKGTFPHTKKGLNIKMPITRIKYSGIAEGRKLFINL